MQGHVAFRSRDTVQHIRERLEAQAGRRLEELFLTALPASPDPAQSLRLLDAALLASSDPRDSLLHLESDSRLATEFFLLGGAHSAIASALIARPDAALALLDGEKRDHLLQREVLLLDGAAYSRQLPDPLHLRPFKLQRLALIVLNGNLGLWDETRQDRALQDLADALVTLLSEAIGIPSLGSAPSVQDTAGLYEQLAEAIRRLEDRHHLSDPNDKGRRLDSILGAAGRRIQALPASLLGLEARHPDARSEVLRRLGTHGSVASHWLDALPESSAFYECLIESDRAFVRFQTLLREDSSLIPAYKASRSLTDNLLNGDFDESFHADSLLRELPTSCSLNALAETFSMGWHSACSWWLIEPSFDLGASLSDLMDALLVHCAHRLYLDFDVIALGSYGRREIAPGSDADVLFLVQDSRLLEAAEQQAADLIALTNKLTSLGAPVKLDVRLRREGSKSLVRTFQGFLKYELEEMQMWQRFELGMVRGILGSEDSVAVATKAAYAQPVTPERLKELLEMKRRIETQNLKPQYRQRDIKLGEGALGDLEWFVHVMEMRYPTATRAGEHVLMEDRIRALGRARLINAIEVHELLMARTHLLELRNRLELMGVPEDVLPENPAKLEALAVRLYAADANDLLLRHERLTKTVRTIYSEAMEALKVW